MLSISTSHTYTKLPVFTVHSLGQREMLINKFIPKNAFEWLRTFFFFSVTASICLLISAFYAYTWLVDSSIISMDKSLLLLIGFFILSFIIPLVLYSRKTMSKLSFVLCLLSLILELAIGALFTIHPVSYFWSLYNRWYSPNLNYRKIEKSLRCCNFEPTSVLSNRICKSHINHQCIEIMDYGYSPNIRVLGIQFLLDGLIHGFLIFILKRSVTIGSKLYGQDPIDKEEITPFFSMSQSLNHE